MADTNTEPVKTANAAVAAAAAELEKSLESTSTDESTQTETPKTSEEGTETTEETTDSNSLEYTDDLSDEEVIRSRQLFRALKDPQQRSAVVEFLAKEAGFVKAPETKKEVTEQKKGIRDYLKETMGEEFDFLEPKLGPALENWAKVQREELENTIQSKLDEKVKPIEEREAEQTRVAIEKQTEEAINSVAGEYYKDAKIPENILNSMSKLMGKISPSQDMTASEYIKNLYILAANENGGVPATVKQQTKANTVKNNPINSLRTAEKPAPGNTPKFASSLKEAISMAEEQMKTAVTN